MSQRNTVVRSLHDLGLAAWFGGTLACAVALNGAAVDVSDPNQRLHVANAVGHRVRASLGLPPGLGPSVAAAVIGGVAGSKICPIRKGADNEHVTCAAC
jgi:hypothetical protein